MIRFWLFIRLALVKIRAERIRQQNKILREQLELAVKDRDSIMKQYFNYVEKVARRK